MHLQVGVVLPMNYEGWLPCAMKSRRQGKVAAQVDSEQSAKYCKVVGFCRPNFVYFYLKMDLVPGATSIKRGC